jgi:hypothetical protein
MQPGSGSFKRDGLAEAIVTNPGAARTVWLTPKSLCHALTLAGPRSTSRPIEPILSSSRLTAATVSARQHARFNAPLTRSDLIKFGS